MDFLAFLANLRKIMAKLPEINYGNLPASSGISCHIWNFFVITLESNKVEKQSRALKTCIVA